MLDPIVDVPRVANPLLNQMLLLNQELITLNRAPRHEENMSILHIVGMLQ